MEGSKVYFIKKGWIFYFVVNGIYEQKNKIAHKQATGMCQINKTES